MTILPPPIKPDSDLSSIPIRSGQDRYQSGILRACLFLGGVILILLLMLTKCAPVRPPETPEEKRAWCAQVPIMREHAAKYARDDIEAEGLELQVREYEEIGKCREN